MNLRIALSTLVASLVFGLAVPACSDDDTSGARLVLRTRVVSAEATKSFTNAAGYTITLDEASLTTGPLYYFDGATITGRRAPERSLFAVRSAHAHPGHYLAGTARGQLLTSAAIDLRKGEQWLGNGEGVTGPVRSATFSFGTGSSGALRGHAVILSGTAEKGGAVRAFRVEVGQDELENASGEPAVEGCPFEPADMKTDGTVTVTVKVPQWFEHVDFAEVPERTSPTLLVPPSLARNQLVRGMKAGAAYVFSYSEGR